MGFSVWGDNKPYLCTCAFDLWEIKLCGNSRVDVNILYSLPKVLFSQVSSMALNLVPCFEVNFDNYNSPLPVWVTCGWGQSRVFVQQ